MKLPLTIKLTYSSRKKYGGRRATGGEASGGGWLSKDIEDDREGDCGTGGTVGGSEDVGLVSVGEGVP
jgi:hypothetical protein